MSGRNKVVVVGSGAAGFGAAVSAASAGAASVTLLEAAEHVGGTTAISGGVAWIPASPWATEVGVEDSEAEGIAYLKGLELGDADPVLAAAYVRDGVRVMQAIEEHTPLRWHLMLGFPDYHAEIEGGKALGRGLEVRPVQVTHEVVSLVRPDPYMLLPATINEAGSGPPDQVELERRQRESIRTRGPGLIAGLCAAFLELGGEVRTGARATSLMTSGDAVVGVEADGRQYSGQVVVASGGFERNPALVRAFLRGPLLAPAGPPSNKGDGLVMGMAIGAALGNMSEAWWCPAMELPGETIDGAPFFRMLFTDCAQPGGVLVDSTGQRFVDEAVNYSDLGRAFHRFVSADYAFPCVSSWLVFDQRRRSDRGFVGDTVWSLSPTEGGEAAPPPAAEPDPDWLLRADSLEGLADLAGVPRDAFRRTIERFNEQAARGGDDDYGRGSYIYDRFSQGGFESRPITEPPFYALRVLPGSLGTKGGLKTDEYGRVLRADGSGTIEGLFAAGNASANPFGLAYPGPGATVGPGLVFGWRAGELASAG